jgi:hypothetical protein
VRFNFRVGRAQAAGGTNELGRGVSEAASSFDGVHFRETFTDASAVATACFNQPTVLKFAVGAGDGAGGEAEVGRELTNGGQLRTRPKLPAADERHGLHNDTSVGWHPAGS